MSDCAHLNRIHKKLYLCSKRAAVKKTGQDVAVIGAASWLTVSYMKRHNCGYAAYVLVGDTALISDHEFLQKFTKAAELLNKALKNPKIKKVYCHCHAGINRSTTTILRYIQLYRPELDYRKCIPYIREQNRTQRKGTPALTNRRFEHLLRKYEYHK